MIDLLHSESSGNTADSVPIRSRWIRDCHFEPIQTAPNGQSHCIEFQLVLAPKRANRDRQHRGSTIDYQRGIVQEFNGKDGGFNFHRIEPNELMMAISLNAHRLDADSMMKWGDDKMAGFRCIDWHSTRSYHGFNALILNQFATGNHSGFFVPNLWSDHGQYLDFSSLLIGLQFLSLWPSDSAMRIGFDSLGAFASFNHLHFEFWDIDGEGLPVEGAPATALSVRAMGRIAIHELDDRYYPLHGLRYRVHVDSDDALFSDLDHLARSILFCVEWLQREDIAFNVLMVPGHPLTVFLTPRQTQSAFDRATDFEIEPGFGEVSGRLVFGDEAEWSQMTVDRVWTALRQRVSIEDGRWEEIKREYLSMDM